MQIFPHGGFPKRDSPGGPPSPPTWLEFTAPERVIAIDPPVTDVQAEFLSAPDGRVQWLRIGLRIHGRE